MRAFIAMILSLVSVPCVYAESGIASVYAHGIAIVVSFILITFLHVILGELVPKSLALQRAEQVALAVAAPMDVFITLTRPLLFVMSRAAGWRIGRAR